jgi:hypothetical protein
MLSQIILIGCIIFGSPLLLLTVSCWRYYQRQGSTMFSISILLLSVIFIVYTYLIFTFGAELLPGWNAGPLFMFGLVAFLIAMICSIYLLVKGYKKGKARNA